jgi:hypothetical protein
MALARYSTFKFAGQLQHDACIDACSTLLTFGTAAVVAVVVCGQTSCCCLHPVAAYSDCSGLLVIIACPAAERVKTLFKFTGCLIVL